MGSGDRAEVRLGATGADDVIRDAESIKSAYVGAAGAISDAWKDMGGRMGLVGSGIKAIGSSITTLTQDTIRLATAANNISLARAVDSARSFDDTLGRIVASKGVQLADLNTKLTATSKAILVGEPAIAAEARAISGLTGDFRGAMEAMQGLGEEAIATGRSADDMAPLGVVLKNVLGVAGDTREELGKIRSQADALGNIGGAATFERQIEALGGVLEGFSAKTDSARNRLTAFAGVLAHGLTPNVAGKVQQQTLGALEGSALEINRTLGRDILDENGNVGDPSKVIRDLAASMQRRGLTGQRALRGWRRYLGNQAGSRVYNALQHGELSEEAIGKLANLGPSAEAHDKAAEFAASDPGHRLGVQLASERGMRGSWATHAMLGAQTGWQDTFGGSPIASGAAGMGLGVATSSVAKGIGGIFNAVGDAFIKSGKESGKALAEGAATAKRALETGGSLAGSAIKGAAPKVAAGAAPAIAGAAESAGVSLAGATGGGVMIAIAGAASIVAAGALAVNQFSEQSAHRDYENLPASQRLDAIHAAKYKTSKHYEGAGVDREVEKPEVSDIIQSIGGKKLSPEEIARIGQDPALANLYKVAQLGHMPTAKDAQLHPEIVAMFDDLPRKIGERVAEAYRDNPPVAQVPDPDHPANKVVKHKKSSHGMRGRTSG